MDFFYKNRQLEDIIYEVDGVPCVEKWKDIEGYEGHYMVSDLGRVKALKRRVNHSFSGYLTMPERMLSQKSRKRGDLEVNLAKDSIHSSKLVHRLVAIAFIDNPFNLPEVNHKYGITNDNRITELEWMTPSENQLHSYKILKRKSTVSYGSKNPNFGNKRLYLHVEMGVYFTVEDIANAFSMKIKSVQQLFWRKPNDRRISNLIKA